VYLSVVVVVVNRTPRSFARDILRRGQSLRRNVQSALPQTEAVCRRRRLFTARNLRHRKQKHGTRKGTPWRRTI